MGNGPGIEIDRISSDAFRAFAASHASSPEIGPIATCLDTDARPLVTPVAIFGLTGCDRVCAAACYQVVPTRRDTDVVKLDAVNVDHALRQRGLASALIAESLRTLLGAGQTRLSRIYAHAVHPGTRRILNRLAFSDPPVTGAPIMERDVADAADRLAARLGEESRRRTAPLRLSCALCRAGDRRVRRWCRPADA